MNSLIKKRVRYVGKAQSSLGVGRTHVLCVEGFRFIHTHLQLKILMILAQYHEGLLPVRADNTWQEESRIWLRIKQLHSSIQRL